MLKGPDVTSGSRASAVLTRPYSGSSSRIQLSVTVNGGRKNAAQNANSTQARPGRAAPGQGGPGEEPGHQHRERQGDELPHEGDGEGVDEGRAEARLAQGRP